MKVPIENLIIEVTRRCNMQCEHCLRGEQQDKDLNLNKLDKFLSNVESVGSITFTGGEPMLNSKAIYKIIDMLEKYNLECSLSLITNGTVECDYNLISKMFKFVGYDNEAIYLAVSRDEYHDVHLQNTVDSWSILAGFSEKSTNSRYLINAGNAKENGLAWRDQRIRYHNVQIEDIYLIEEVHFSVDGRLFGDCDLSYEEMKYSGGETVKQFLQRYSERVEEENE